MKPKLRHVEIIPFEDKFLLKDPIGISRGLLVSKDALPLLFLMDGERTLLDIKAEYLRLTGYFLTDEELEAFLKALDQSLLLKNERYKKALDELRQSMLSEGLRRMSHLGEVYPPDAHSCRLFLIGERKEEKLSPLGILVPHMDLRVAKETYWEAYGRLKEDKELVVILGVSHYWHELPFSVLPLDMETPFGVLKTDRKLLERLQSFYSFDLTQDILSYRYEHSVEFASLYAKMLFPEARALAIIVSHGEKELLKTFAENLLRTIEPHIHKTLIISSVDLSHVGRKFGDYFSYDPSFRDIPYLRHLECLEYNQAFDLLEVDQNRTRIDGKYTNFVFGHMLKTYGVEKGRLLDYRIYEENFTDSKVSYASMVFY
ncbi:AmmeMemoRadiSam system protein B [Thermocrinis sp.]